MLDDVRRVGIRQFQQGFHKELKELPFIVTKDGQDYCVVTPFTAINDVAKMLRPNDITTPVTTDPKDIVFPQNLRSVDVHIEPPETGKCEMPNTGCKGIGYRYLVT